ncbi:MAG: hypothetical protein R6V58_04135 [Planctomycetota bacterium]
MEIVCKRAALRVLAAAAVLASAPPGRAQVLPTRYRQLKHY